jgi:hypothetical protein
VWLSLSLSLSLSTREGGGVSVCFGWEASLPLLCGAIIILYGLNGILVYDSVVDTKAPWVK